MPETSFLIIKKCSKAYRSVLERIGPTIHFSDQNRLRTVLILATWFPKPKILDFSKISRFSRRRRTYVEELDRYLGSEKMMFGYVRTRPMLRGEMVEVCRNGRIFLYLICVMRSSRYAGFRCATSRRRPPSGSDLVV